MPTALYLYNSDDPAAANFYAALKTALARADWGLQSDADGAFDDTAGRRAFEVISERIREVHTIVFAVGPRGMGSFQRDFEAGDIFRANQEAQLQGRRLRIVPALIAGASYDQLPDELRDIVAKMDQTHRGGRGLLAAVFRQITGKALVTHADASRPPSTMDDVSNFCSLVHRKAKNGLTLFVGPYAAVDVHDNRTPGKLGAMMLEDMGVKADPTELLAHPWIASEARRVIWPDRDETDIWDVMRELLRAEGQSPLPLDRRLATLARIWQDEPPSKETPAAWSGLLFVTTDQHVRLENALYARGVKFGRLRYSTRGLLVYERIDPDAPDLAYKQEWLREAVRPGPSSNPNPRPDPDIVERVLIFKLMDSIDATGLPPMTTRDHLRSTRELATLPLKITQHLQGAPFVMLGGGFLDPLVSFAFATHFRPAFDEAAEAVGVTPRFVAFDSTPGRPDMIRTLERRADVTRANWLTDVFELRRIDWPLTDLVSRLTDQFRPPVITKEAS